MDAMKLSRPMESDHAGTPCASRVSVTNPRPTPKGSYQRSTLRSVAVAACGQRKCAETPFSAATVRKKRTASQSQATSRSPSPIALVRSSAEELKSQPTVPAMRGTGRAKSSVWTKARTV